MFLRYHFNDLEVPVMFLRYNVNVTELSQYS